MPWTSFVMQVMLCLRVQHRLQVQNGLIGHRGEGDPSGIPIFMVLVPVFALTMVAAWVFMRYRQQLWKTCSLSVLPMKIYFTHPPSLLFCCVFHSVHSQIWSDWYPPQTLLFRISNSSYSNGKVKVLFEGKLKKRLLRTNELYILLGLSIEIQLQPKERKIESSCHHRQYHFS